MKRIARYATAALTLLLLLGLVVRERYAPRLTLYLGDLLTPAPRPLSVDLSDMLSLRLHANTRPHVGKIASLQKGLILVHRERALIEEGYGFGLPIVEADGIAHISRHADITPVRQDGQLSLVKAYHIDIADRPTHPFRVKYAEVDPLGTVVFTYTIRPPDAVDVTVDFRGLGMSWERAYLMNEQGARAFTRYLDPIGGSLHAAEVGIWEEATAPFGCWEAPSHKVRFCVEAEPGTPGFVGRERYRQYNWLGFYTLSWSGIDVVVDGPVDVYEYTIRLEERDHP